jgi:hypothetical protein
MIPHPLGEPVGNLKDHALAYAELGLEVFPLNADKTPRTTHGWKEATTDTALIEAWWTRWPGALIGCRIPAGLVLLDVDPRHGGVETWKLIRTMWGPPLTRAHKSGRGDGGGHTWWIRPADKLSVRKLDDWAKEHGVGHAVSETRWVSGIDVLHWDHRYTILPPSPHPETGQPYQWVIGRGLDFEPLTMPVDLAELISADEEPPSPPPAPRILDPDSPADWYSHHYTCGDVLAGHGWKVVAGDGAQDRSRWKHPTATASYSATIRYGCLFVYSPNTPFEVTEPGRPHGYTPFAAYAMLEHGDDQSAAARAVRTMRGQPEGVPWDFVPSEIRLNGQHSAAMEEEAPAVVLAVPWPHIAPEAFHGVLGETVQALAPHTEADPAGVLACLLVYFGAAAGPGPHFRLSGATHTGRLNVLVVGDSARARKGSAEAVIRWVMEHADPAIATSRRGTGINSGEGLIEAVRDEKWGKDKSGADVMVDEGIKDKRLLLYEPEFAGRLMPAIRRSGSTISALLRMAWDDGNLQTMTRNPLKATGAHICVIGNATIDELLLEMSPSDIAGGLMNRFLFVAVRAGHLLPFGGTIDDQGVGELGRTIRRQLDRARVRSRIDFGETAKARWADDYERLRADSPDGPLGHLTARGPIQVQRLALVYALADDARCIEADHLVAAQAMWEFCRASAALVVSSNTSGSLTGNPDADQMLELLVGSGKAWAARDLALELGWSGAKVAAVRGRLERLSLVRLGVLKGTGGRPKTVVEAK